MEMKYAIRWIIGCLLCIIVFCSVKEKRCLAAELRLPDRIMSGNRSSMPAEGEVHVLVLAVDFPDKKYDGDIRTDLAGMSVKEAFNQSMFGETDETSQFYPYESVRAYYERSSFGKFSLNGDVYAYTAKKNRDQYEENQDELIREIFASYRSEIIKRCPESEDENQYFNDELAKYDQDKDKILDGIYIYCTGAPQNTGYSKKWGWVDYCNDYRLGNYLTGSLCFIARPDVNKICRQTGQMLGLPEDEYYQNPNYGTGGNDMMNNDQGDHSAFSKILLGWIGAGDIQLITEGASEVQLTDCAREGKCAVIVPDYKEDTGLLTKFLLVDYMNYTGNNDTSLYAYHTDFPANKGGVRIYRVDATLQSSGLFMRNNNSQPGRGYVPLIRQVHADVEDKHIDMAFSCPGSDYTHIFLPFSYKFFCDIDGCLFHGNDELTPDSMPSSALYGDDFCDLVYSGAYIRNIRLNGDSVTFTAGIETEPKKKSVTHTIFSTTDATYIAADGPKVIVQFSSDIIPAREDRFDYDWSYEIRASFQYKYQPDGVSYCHDIVYLQDKDGNKVYDLLAGVSITPEGTLYISKPKEEEKILEPDQEYEIVIPAGTLKDSLGNMLEEIKIPYTTKTKYERQEDFSVADNTTDSLRCIDENGTGILINQRWKQSSLETGTLYRMEHYQIAETIDCPEELLCEAGREEKALWGNEDGTWTLAAYDEEEDVLNCVTFDTMYEIKEKYIIDKQDFGDVDSYIRGVGERYFYAGKYLYLLGSSSYKKRIEFDVNIRDIGMAADGSFVANLYSVELYLYDSEGNLANSFSFYDFGLYTSIKKFGTFTKCSGGYLMSLHEYYDYLGIDQDYTVWQFDQDFKLVKKYRVPKLFKNMVPWEKGYICQDDKDLYLMDFDFHEVDILKDVLKDDYSDDRIQLKRDNNLFISWNHDSVTAGATVVLSSYDDSDIEKKYQIAREDKPAETAGEVVEVQPGTKASEYIERTGYKNIFWMNLNEEYITDETYMGISTEDGSYTEYFYFHETTDAPVLPSAPPVTDPTSTPIPTSTPTPTPTSTSTPTLTPTSTLPSTPGALPTGTLTPVPTKKATAVPTATAPSKPGVQTTTVSPTAAPTPNPTRKPKKKVKRLNKPVIRVTTRRYNKNTWIAKIRLKKYQGTYVEIYYRRGKGKFRKIKLRQINIKKNKSVFKVGYKRNRKKTYIRIRTYRRKNGKKIYSKYSSIYRLKT